MITLDVDRKTDIQMYLETRRLNCPKVKLCNKHKLGCNMKMEVIKEDSEYIYAKCIRGIEIMIKKIEFEIDRS